MKITVSSKKLLHGLEIVKPVVTSNKIMPICDNVLIKSDNDCIALIATNLHHSIITQVTCEVEGKINVLLPFMDIYNICKGISDQPLSIEFGKSIKVTSINGLYNIGCTDEIKDFPKVEIVNHDTEMEIPSSEISQIKSRSVKFIHPDEINTNKHGVCFDFENDTLNVTATNNACFSLYKIQCKSTPNRYLLSKETIDLLQLFSLSKGDVILKFSEGKFQAENSDTILIAQQIADRFPDYKQLIMETDRLTEVNRMDLLNSLLRSFRFSMEDRVTFSFSDTLNISSKNDAYAKDFNESIDVVNSSGFEDNFSVVLNAKQISDYLSVCSSENINIMNSSKNGNMFYIQEPKSESIFLAMRYL